MKSHHQVLRVLHSRGLQMSYARAIQTKISAGGFFTPRPSPMSALHCAIVWRCYSHLTLLRALRAHPTLTFSFRSSLQPPKLPPEPPLSLTVLLLDVSALYCTLLYTLRALVTCVFCCCSLLHLTPVLSTCPLHTNSGCGKERRILFGPW